MAYCFKKMKDGLLISWPPGEKHPGNLLRVVYVIDIATAGAKDAAQEVHKIMTDPNSIKPVLHAMTSRGKVIEIDLSGGIGKELLKSKGKTNGKLQGLDTDRGDRRKARHLRKRRRTS